MWNTSITDVHMILNCIHLISVLQFSVTTRSAFLRGGTVTSRTTAVITATRKSTSVVRTSKIHKSTNIPSFS